MKSLGDHFKDIDNSSATYNTFPEKDIEYLLSSCFVVKNCTNLDLPYIRTNLNHQSIVDNIIVYLLKRKLFKNVLTFGYTLAKTDNVSQSLYCTSTNFNVTLIKSHIWKKLHIRIGTERFVDLLINFTVLEYINGYFRQIIGNINNKPHLPATCFMKEENINSTFEDLITNKTFIHKEFPNKTFDGPKRLDMEVKILKQALSDLSSGSNSTFPSSNYENCIMRLERNCRRKTNFTHLVNKLCPTKSVDQINNHLDNQTDVQDVIRFVILVLEKLLPQEIYGSRRNKSLIFSRISEMLRLPLNGAMHIEDMLAKIRLKKCSWLWDARACHTRDHFLRSSQYLEKFLMWYFKILVPNIVVYFFYCTEISSSIQVVYFRRNVWQRIISKYKREYFENQLTENIVCRNHSSYTLSEFNHSRLRVIPKKADGQFRMISIPGKGMDEIENNAYKENLRNVIVPVQVILRYIRQKRVTNFKKFNSTTEIAKAIEIFKISLLDRHKVLPTLHLMKFDIESCYDSIPRNRLLKILRQLLKSENGFLVRSKSIFNPRSGVLTSHDIVNGSDLRINGEVEIDKVRTKFFSTNDVLSVVENELFKTVLWIGNKCYLRKDGLFQGSSLSGLLVDILYDDLLQHYVEFQTKSTEETLIIRLADDFLIISTDEARIRSIKNLVLGGFVHYNAMVNIDKVIIENSQFSTKKNIQFCALDISVDTLEVWKNSDTLNITKLSSSSSQRLFTRLERIFNMRLSFDTINGNLNSIKVIYDQIGFITSNIATIMLTAFRNRNMKFNTFVYFVNNIYRLTVSRYTDQKLNILHQAYFRQQIVETFLLQFVKYSSKYISIINYLREENAKCNYVIKICK